jgi:chitinase
MNVPEIIGNLDFVILSAFDVQTPERNPKEADFSAPIYALNERTPEANVDAQVGYWITNKAPASKIIVGIPTFGRAWQLKEESGITGVPPLNVRKKIS